MTITVDLHGLTVDMAKRKLLRAIETAPSTCEKLTVIHGCNNGTALRDMVRSGLHSYRILEITPTFANDGETTVWLKTEKSKGIELNAGNRNKRN